MADSNFVDYVKIFTRSGSGGGGSTHFYRDKLTAKGGPDGGDGGRGGHVILRGNSQLWTLIHLKYRKHIFAEDGVYGSSNKCTGAEGDDVYIDVPLGTVARDGETGDYLFEITDHGQEIFLRKGGRGGQGNWHFRTATMQAPRFSQPGEEGTEGWNILELKLLADVGLVGFPNAGKSTLLASISAAKPKIADYPFTTLEPNLGIVAYREHLSFVMADIPGIIEGAADGKGLGVRFLRHIERNSLLLFMVSAERLEVLEEYEILLGELRKFNPELLDKQRILAITKSDLIDAELENEMRKNLPNIPCVFISSVAGIGITKLKDIIWNELNK
jgi:GTP-binding protein